MEVWILSACVDEVRAVTIEQEATIMFLKKMYPSRGRRGGWTLGKRWRDEVGRGAVWKSTEDVVWRM